MALVKCPECNNDISSRAKICPGCGAPVNVISRMLRLFGSIALTVAVIALLLWTLGRTVDRQNIQIYGQLTDDAVSKYMIVKRNGPPSRLCISANYVTNAYLEAKNEAEYKKWKEIEAHDCATGVKP